MKSLFRINAFSISIPAFLLGIYVLIACGSTSDVERIDTTSPAEITNLNAVAGHHQVILSWLDLTDEDLEKIAISYSPGNNQIEVPRGVQAVNVNGLINDVTYTFILRTVDNSGNRSAGVTSNPCMPYTPESGGESDDNLPIVYMTSDISSNGLMSIYNALERTPANGQKVAVKITTGEGRNSNHLRPELIRELVTTVNGDLVECNTAYGGSRASTALHYQVAADRGYTASANVVIMDERNTLDIPIVNGND